MNTAARPTSECIAATSWGISVMPTRVAMTTPAAPPMTTIRITSQSPVTPGARSVARNASAMPVIPYQTARLALSCPERPPSDRMKSTAAAT